MRSRAGAVGATTDIESDATGTRIASTDRPTDRADQEAATP